MTTLRSIIVVFAITLLVSACGGAGTAAPDATPALGVPPAPATSPAVSASVPAPARTPGPLGASAIKIKEAIERSKSVTKARFSMSFVTGETQNGKYSETPYMSAQGELDGAVNHFTFKGGVLNQAFGNADTVEMVTDGSGKTYIRGAQVLPSMDPKAWYYTEGGAADPPLTVNDVLDFTDADTDWQSAKDAGTESLDGQTCSVHTWNPSDSAVEDMVKDADNQEAFNVVDKAEYRVTICPDGYVHRMKLDVLGHAKADTNNKGALKLELRLSDIGSNAIKIAVPTDAKPMLPQ